MFMKNYICTVEFVRDKNLINRVYWYRSDFPIEVGDEIVAPIGVHNKLQSGVVRSVYIEEENGELVRVKPSHTLFSVGSGGRVCAPYPIDKLKTVVCKYGYRRVKLPSCRNARDLGGLFYDERHLTAYGNFLRGDIPSGDLFAYGIDAVVYFGNERPSGLGCSVVQLPSLLDKDFTNSCLKEIAVKETEEEEIFSSFERSEAMKEAFAGLAALRGTALLSDGDGGSADIACMALFLLVGVAPEDIVKDRLLSAGEFNRKSQQNVKFSSDFPCRLPREKYLSFIKRFIKTYGSAEKYLEEIGLNEEEIGVLKRRMMCYEFFGE